MKYETAFVALLSVGGAPALKLSAKAKAKSEFMAGMKSAANAKGLKVNRHLRSEAVKRNILYKSKELSGRGLGNSTSYNYDPYTADDDHDFSDLFFDMSKFSLKVHSCSTLTNFDLEAFKEGGNQGEEEEQEQEQDNSGSSTFINYRLCPSDSCRDGSWKGCRTVYGNYMVSLEDYFEAHQKYSEESFEEYCGYCKYCDYISTYMGATCELASECTNSTSICYKEEDGGEEAEEAEVEEINYEEFIECTPVELYVDENKNATYYNRRAEEAEEENLVYLQIYCDGTLKIGMYSDDACSSYIGDQYDMSEMTGLPITENDLEEDFLSSECVSCTTSGSKFYMPEQKSGDGNGDGSQDEEEEINEMCEQMYENSLKCNEKIPFNYTAYYDEEGVVEEWEESVNNVTCAFLESVQKGEDVSTFTVVTTAVSSGVSNFYDTITENVDIDLSNEQYAAIGLVALGAVGAGIYVSRRNRKIDSVDINEGLYVNPDAVAA